MCAALTLSVFATPARAQPSRPNVLFIIIDDLNDWVGPLDGYPGVKTPNIDRLAQRGVVFTRAYCASPACSPSRTAALTGIRPATSGVYDNAQTWRHVMRDVVTLPQHFQAHGYETAGGGKVFHLPDPTSWHEFFPTLADPGPAVRPAHGLTQLPAELDWAPLDVPDSAMGDYKLTTWAIDYLSRPHTDPFFLAVGLFRPHGPLYTPRSYFDLYPLQDVVRPAVIANDLADIPLAGYYLAKPNSAHTPIVVNNLWEAAVQGYLAAISFADMNVGRLLDALDASPYANNTIVFLWGDNGWHLGEKQHWTKFTLWEEATRVPLIIARPGASAAVCPRTVSTNDLYPTLIELCNLTPRSGLEGEDLTPLLDDPQMPWDRPAVMTYQPGNHAVRSERWRYVRYADGSEELYDHDNDPQEWTNLALNSTYASVKADLAAWLPAVNAPSIPQPPTRIYVHPYALGQANGVSWTNAYTDLTDALTVAANSKGVVKEVWVSAGTYKPRGVPGDRRATFHLVEQVAVYGGFTGSETDLSQRNYALHPTILTGDLAGNDGSGPNDTDDNAYHVVTANYWVEAGTLDGFTITGGRANGPGRHGTGAGVYIYDSFPTIRNCVLTGNVAVNGGAVYCEAQRMCVFVNCVFANNTAQTGSAIYSLNATPSLTNCTLLGNTCVPPDPPALIRTTGSLANVSIVNSILWGNTPSSPCIRTDNGQSTTRYSCAQGGVPGIAASVITQDPRFADANGRLRSDSPCIDKGRNADVPSSVMYDLGENRRIAGPTVDMGAYEFAVVVRSDFDVDHDGDVDLSDFGMFVSCFNGPNRPYGNSPVCHGLDTDDDQDVDLADFGQFMVCFNGPGRPPSCGD